MFTLDLGTFKDTKNTLEEAVTVFGEMCAIAVSRREFQKKYFSDITVTDVNGNVWTLNYDKKSKTVVVDAPIIAAVEAPTEALTTHEVCYNAFTKVDMNNSVERRAAIDMLVETNGFKKTVVQSYASNFRKN